jgi:16S rRNA (cytosine1402-N4)-methyltransferase
MSNEGKKSAFTHQPVLLKEVIEAMQIRPDGVYIDGTFGRGGHAAAILEILNDKGRLIVMDKDPQAVACAEHKFSGDKRVIIIHDDYALMKEHIKRIGLANLVDGVLLDLGVSSPQLDEAARGFSFQHNGPLDMRMNTKQGITANEWIMSASEKEIADVLWRLGEERFSRRIAQRIVEFRQHQDIADTSTLATIISDCVPSGKEKKHPATRSFQAIRMKINHELDHISLVLDEIFDVLKIGGRLLVISFHSLEDRLVKRFIKKHSTAPLLPRGLPLRERDITVSIRLKAIGKAIKAGAEELMHNPRSRSAVLRIAERVS